ncbi:MAG: helix-turn-helix domain-containing protein [Anaerolineales bacterium]|nr:helix-turn-helix domain-containing protein [Anaerolineales bacterium]
MTAIDPRPLIELGLSKYEARAYLALLGHDDSTAVEVADRAGVPRQRVYDVLISLRDKGLISIRDGRPARHTARPPAEALSAIYEARLRAQRQENERLAELIQRLIPDLESIGNNGNNSNGLLTRPLKASEETIGGF